MRQSAGSSGPRRRDAGFALLAALGVSLALALIASATLREGRTAARVAAHAVAAAEARAAAEAGLWRAAARWAAGEAAPFGDWSFEGVAVRADGAPERNWTDLNRAGADALAAAAASAGHPEPAAFAEAVLARRAALAAAGVPWRLDARAFDVIEEARGLAPAATWPALAARLTTHGGETAGAAPRPAGAPAPGEVLRVTAEATHPAGTRAAIDAVLRVEEGGALTTLEWRRIRPSPARR